MYGLLVILVHVWHIPLTMIVVMRSIAVSVYSLLAPKRIVARHILHFFNFFKVFEIFLDFFEVVDQVLVLSLDSIFFIDVIMLVPPCSYISLRHKLEEGVFVISVGNSKLIFVQGFVSIAREEPAQV